MRVFMLFGLIGFAFAAPQAGYNYQQVEQNAPAGNQYTEDHFQIQQQYAVQQQQQHQQQFVQQQLQAPYPTLTPIQAQYQPQVELQLQQVQQQIQLQQLPQQQPQSQQQNFQPQQTIFEKTPEVSQASQSVVGPTANNHGYHFANQLVQQAQQLVHYEQQQEQQQKQDFNVVTNTGYETAAPAVQQQGLLFQAQQPTQPQHVEQQLQLLAEKIQKSTISQAPLEHHTQTLPLTKQYIAPQASLRAAPEHYQPNVKYNKEFYFLAAPKDDSDDVPENLDQHFNTLKKNLRVVFIKAPEQNGLANAALQLAKQSVQSQTAIYVLTKQHDAADLASKLQNIHSSSNNSKPEVIFIKYKTPEEAEHAQRTIQAQYEALDGSNNYNYEGVVPSQNFVGSTSLDPRNAVVSKQEAKSPAAQYLPADTKKH